MELGMGVHCRQLVSWGNLEHRRRVQRERQKLVRRDILRMLARMEPQRIPSRKNRTQLVRMVELGSMGILLLERSSCKLEPKPGHLGILLEHRRNELGSRSRWQRRR
jgi:hypothetical protein